MLVIARKRHEAITIDGNIRVEVLRLAGGVARLRFVAPRRTTITRGVARPGDSVAAEAVNGGVDASGMGVVDLTLGNHQIVTIRNEIHLGLIDLDAMRALIFIDAPTDLSVKAEAAVKTPTSAVSSHPHAGDDAVQALLPFSPLPDADTDRPGPSGPPQRLVGPGPGDSAIHTIPFPTPEEFEERER